MAVQEKNKEKYAIAKQWAEQCLVEDGSLFGKECLWTLQAFQELREFFIKHPDETDRDFMTKMKDQLEPSQPATKQLAAEILWVMYLFSSTLNPSTKIFKIRKVWLWSGEDLPEVSQFMTPSLLEGIGSPGPAYNTYFWLEFSYFIVLFISIKKLPALQRQALLKDPFEFATFIDAEDAAHTRQFYHIISHLLFPDYFEQCSSRHHKNLIVVAFGDDSDKKAVNPADRVSIDRVLYNIRARLAAHYSEAFNYYTEPVQSLWLKPKTPEASVEIPPNEVLLPDPYAKVRIWLIAPGEKARLWERFKKSSHIAVGFSLFDESLVDLTKGEIYKRLALEREDGIKPSNDALAIWEFVHEMAPGDFVIAKQGRSLLLGLGKITSEYRYDGSMPEYRHVRTVDWFHTGKWSLNENEKVGVKTLTEMTVYRDWLFDIFKTIGVIKDAVAGKKTRDPVPAVKLYELKDALENAFFDESEITSLFDDLKIKKNVILAGPPGTGKSWLARRLAWLIIGSEDASRLLPLQFHQSYSYEDFVRGYKPVIGGFSPVDGPFLSFCEKASGDADRAYVILIDEINRGNPSAIFGELLSLLEVDKRTEKYAITLSCHRPDEKPFFIPQNIHIIGTMNNTDRSLSVVDFALRRRFAFYELRPAFDRDQFLSFMHRQGIDDELLNRLIDSMTELNRKIADDRELGQHYMIGHSFFTSIPDDSQLDEKWYQRIVKREICPLIDEYCFDSPEKARKWKEMIL